MQCKLQNLVWCCFRYGTVVVKIGDKELATLGRGKFVGERTLVTGKLRSASCVAQTRVTAIVMNKKEFLDVSNPMLDWMIPYDAARAVLTFQPVVKQLTSDQFESLLDHFEPKQEALQDTQIIAVNSPIDKLWVFITGSVELRDADGQVTADPDHWLVQVLMPWLHGVVPVCRLSHVHHGTGCFRRMAGFPLLGCAACPIAGLHHTLCM